MTMIWTPKAILEQLEKCEYECTAGDLKYNHAFVAFKQQVQEAVGQDDKITEALRVLVQYVDVAIDWNFEEVEIDGEMRSSYSIRDQLKEALALLDPK